MSEYQTRIGNTIAIFGDVVSNEDIIIEGHIKAPKVDAKKNAIIIGKKSVVEANLYARDILVTGKVIGNVYAEDRITMAKDSQIEGDLYAPRIDLADGCHYKGQIAIQPVTNP